VPGDPARKANPNACQGARPMHWARRAAPKQDQGNADKTPILTEKALLKTSKPSDFFT